MRQYTGKEKITYVGHSQGTSQMFSALSEGYGNLDEKINFFVALAPIVNLHLSKGVLSTLNNFIINSL